MSSTGEENDRLLWVLCARALQRSGQGFPSTDEEIAAYEAQYRASPEEKRRCAALVKRILTTARKELEAGTNGVGVLKNIVPITSQECERHESPSPLAAAARKSDGEPMSEELREEVERIIDESSTDGDEEKKNSEQG